MSSTIEKLTLTRDETMVESTNKTCKIIMRVMNEAMHVAYEGELFVQAFNMLSEVQHFYSSKTIFITGATGYLGQMLISKLLCSCREISCIYILIRAKSGKTLHDRMNDILENPIFERAKSLHPDFSTKVKPIQGECYESYLGISDSDRALIENQVEIIFHVAAYVNFNAPLRKAGYINVRSLDHLFDIAKEMKHLKAFVYVSTAFSPSTETNFIEEKFYHPPLNSRKLLSMLDDLDDAVLDEITPSLMKSYSNRYIFTKLIAEDLFRERASGLPACIFRPSIVLPCYKEPLPGWINNAYSVIAITLGYALGILKVVRANASFRACMVPGDYSTNALILSAYYTSKSWQQDKSWEKFQFDVPIVNYSNCTTKFRITWEIFKIQGIKATEKYPFYDMVTLPSIVLTSNSFKYRCFTFLFHNIPAVIFDTILRIIRKKPRFQRIYQKVHKFMDVMVPFSTRELTVSTRNINEIWETLSKKDKKLFYCNLDDINIDDYSDVIVRGVRLYLANDKEETISKARRKLFVLRILYFAGVLFFVLLFWYFLRVFF